MSGALFRSDWRNIRRYAVPARMVAECAEARQRGDWRAACEAARIDVDIDPDLLVEAPVAHLAPDLLRWHLPRVLHGSTEFAARRLHLLVPDSPVGPDTVLLTVRSADSAHGSQRLRLGAVRGAAVLLDGPAAPFPAYFWDVRSIGRLPAALGSGSAASDRRAAFAAAGFEFTAGQDDKWRSADRNRVLTPLDPWRLAHDTRWLAARLGERAWTVSDNSYWQPNAFRYLTVFVDGDTTRVSWTTTEGRPCIPIDLVCYSADQELIRQGQLAPGALHPLVRDVLYPDAPAEPFVPTDGEVVRVRCNGVWHAVEARLGRLDPLAHTLDERRRERALQAFGGATGGCFAVERMWYGGLGRLPRRLREYRAGLWQRLIHGGTRTLCELLDAGLDPYLRDGTGGTLIHRIAAFDHREMLPRLLAAGVGLDTVDKEGYTALHRTVQQLGPADVIMTLVDAGADLSIRNRDGETVLDHVRKAFRYGDRLRPDLRAALVHLREQAP